MCLAASEDSPSFCSFRARSAEPLLCQGLDSVFSFFMQLLDYVMTTLLFSDKNVDSNLITWNRVVLLHGKHFGFV